MTVERLERLVVGVSMIVAAVVWRCFVVPVDAPVWFRIMSFLPPLKTVDVVTVPLVALGAAVLAGVPGRRWFRRLLGLVLLAAAIVWPALVLPHSSPVVWTLSATHGMHLHDVLSIPGFGAALLVLAPWGAPLFRSSLVSRSARPPIGGAPALTPIPVRVSDRRR